MKNRREFLLMLTAGVVALAVVAAPVIADELFGTITAVNVEGKSITVVEKGTDKEVTVKVSDDTEYVTSKETSKLDLEKLSRKVEKAKEKGRRGIRVQVTHEKKVASQIKVAAKKKSSPDEN